MNSVLRISPSRLGLGYVALAVLALAFLAVPLWSAWRVNLSTFKTYIEGEDMQRLVNVFHREGASGLAAAMESRARSLPAGEIMVFADASKQRLAGTLPMWPVEVPDAPGTYGLVIGLGGGASMRVVVSHVTLPGGYHLLMGRESVLFQSFIERFWYGIAGAMVLVLGVGAAIGWLIRRALLSEVHEISRTAFAIANGDLSRRLVTRSGSPELDTLARTVNDMLARLASQNVQLEGEVAVRREAEQALHRAHDELGELVAQRTAELGRANESLRLSEERYARAMDASDAGYWDWNVLTGEMFQSTRMKELLGFAPEARFADRDDFVARVPYHPDDRERVFEAIAATIDGVTDRYDIDYRVILPYGATRWVRARGKVYRDEQGRAIRVAGSLSDNTDRKLAEEALRRSEERFALAVAGSTDGIWDWDLLTGEMFISERAQRLYGLEPGPTVRRRTEWRTAVALHPDDAEAQRGAVEDYLAGRAPAYDGEWRVRHPDGTYRWIRIRGLCVRDDAGRVARVAGSVSDIDKQKSAEDALRLSEQRYERAMLAGEAGFWEWTAATDHFYASPRLLEMGGFPPGTTFAGRSDSLSRTPYHPEDLARWNEATAAAFAGKRDRVEMEMRVLRSGETRWVHLDGLCTRDATGGVARWTGSAIDITERKRAEEALRLSEERYARAMEGSDAGHWDWNILTDEMFVSERAREMLALPAGPLPERRSEIMERVPMHADDRDTMAAQVNAGIRSGIYERDYRVILRPGEVRWLRSRGKVYHDAHGAAVRMTGSLTDVTERKLAADALRASEERYSLAMEASEEGYVYVDVDTGEFVTSERLNEIFGIAPATRFRGRRDFLRKFRFYGNDGEIYQQAIRAIEADGGSNRYQFEFRIVLPSGEVRWIWTRGKVMRDTEGRPRRRVGVFSDITARKLAEEALRASEARFRVLTELSSDWYWEQDANLCFTYLSNQVDDLTGYSGESSLGKTRWEIANMTSLSCSWAEHQAVLAARQPFRDFECRRYGPDGTVRYLTMSGAPIFDEQRRFIGYQGIGRNITERKRIEEALRLSEARYARVMEATEEGHWEWDVVTDVHLRLRPGEPDVRILRRRALRQARGLRRQRSLPPGRPGTHRRVDPGWALGHVGSARFRISHRPSARGGAVDARALEGAARPGRCAAARHGGAGRHHRPETRRGGGAGAPGHARPRREGRARSGVRIVDRRGRGREPLVTGPRGDVRARTGLVRRHLPRPGRSSSSRRTGRRSRPRSSAPTRPATSPPSIGSCTPTVQCAGCRRRAGCSPMPNTSRRAWSGSCLMSPIGTRPRRSSGGSSAGCARRNVSRRWGRWRAESRTTSTTSSARSWATARWRSATRPKGAASRATSTASSSPASAGARSSTACWPSAVAQSANVCRSTSRGWYARCSTWSRRSCRRSVTVHAKLHAGRAAVLGDATQVHQVVANLATNAIQAMPAGGTLRIELAIERVESPRAATIGAVGVGEHVVLTVADTGAGIAPGIVDRIFDPFFTTKEVGTGTGLGLSLVHGIVTQLGGAIDVASSLGNGSTFTVYLPRSGDAAESVDEKESALPRGEASRC